MSRRRKTIYQRIMAAADRGTGLRLTFEDAAELANTGFLIAVVAVDNETDEEENRLRSEDRRRKR